MALESGQRVFKRYRALVDGFLKENLKTGVFDIPNLGALCNASFELYENLVFLYESNLPTTGVYGPVDDGMKAHQAMALDGLFYAYNLNYGDFNLYTANKVVLNSLHGGGNFNRKKTYEHNMHGVVNAMRIDVEYRSPHSGLYDARAVMLVGDRKLEEENFLFVPYYVISRAIQMIRTLMRAGRVVEIVHNAGAAEKRRLVSLNQTVLSEYNDDSDFTSNLGMIDFRYTGSVYLPVVGAPITTSGITRVDFASLDRVSTVHRRRVDIEKANNEPFNMIRREIIEIFVRQVFASTNDDVKPLLWEMTTYLDIDIPYDSTEEEYIRALTTLDQTRLEFVWDQLPPGLLNYANRAGKIVDRFEPVDIPKDTYELREMMNRAVYRIVGMRADGSFFTVYGTNNNRILRLAYGSDYVSRYEDQGVKLRSFLYSYNRDGVQALNRKPPEQPQGIVRPKEGSPEPSSYGVQYGGETRAVNVRKGLESYGLQSMSRNIAGSDERILNYILRRARQAEEEHRKQTPDKLLVRALFVSHQLGDSIYRYIIPEHIYSIARASQEAY